MKLNRIFMRRTTMVLGLACIMLFLACGVKVAFATGTVQEIQAGSVHGSFDLTGYTRIMEDPERTRTIEDMIRPEVARSFIPYRSSSKVGSISKSVYWVAFRITNTEHATKDMILELDKPHLDHVGFYQMDEKNVLLKKVDTGRSLPFKERPIENRNFIFKITLPPDTHQQIYFRIQTDSYLQVPLKLWEVDAFTEKEQNSALALGLFYGIMLVMAIYNGFLLMVLKERAYLYYVVIIFSFTMMQSIWDGLAYQYLWPGFPIWEAKSNPIMIAFAALFALLFTQNFLSVANYSTKIGKLFRVTISGLVLAIPAMVMLSPAQSTKIAVYLATISLSLCLLSIVTVRFRTSSAQYYGVAWLMLIVGTSLNLLAAYKILPLTPLTLYSPRFGMVAEAILLSLALADRFNGLKKAKLLEEKHNLLLKDLHEVTKTLTSTYDLDRLLTYSLHNLSKITACEAGCILLKSETGYVIKAEIGEIRLLSEAGNFEQEVEHYFRGTMADQLVRGYYQTGTPSVDGEGAATRLGIPIFHQNRMLGMILLFSRSIRTVPENEQAILVDFAGQVGISIENARLFQEIHHMASTDRMTGAYNRTTFLQLAEESFKISLEKNIPLSLIMVDIDYFKMINDRHGHLAGDKVIQEVVQVLTKMLQSDGIIGRYGGEEFIIMLPGMEWDKALSFAENLRESISRKAVPLDEGERIRFTISLGIAAAGRTTKNVEELINQADTALYRAKEAGRNRVEGYGEGEAS